MEILLLHFVLLVWLSAVAAAAWFHDTTERVMAAAVFGWANLILSSIILSPFGLLGSPAVILPVSLGIASITGVIARFTPAARTSVLVSASAPMGIVLPVVACVVGLAVAAGVATTQFVPLEPSALAFSIPRSLLHVGAGNFFPPPMGDIRPVLLPLNLSLVHSLILANGVDFAVLPWVNLFAWLIASAATYQIARSIGASPANALVASGLVACATPVIAAGSSTHVALPAAAMLMTAVAFGYTALASGHARQAAVAGLAAGLAAGAELTSGALVLLAGIFALCTVSGRKLRFWAAIGPGLGLGLAPTVQSWLAAPPGTLARLFEAWQQSGSATLSANWAALTPIWRVPEVLHPPTDDNSGLGASGLAALAAAIWLLCRAPRRTSLAGGLSLLSVLAVCAGAISCASMPPSSPVFATAIVFAGPALALALDSFARRSQAWFAAVTLAVAGASLWSAHLYLRYNASHPLEPVFNPSAAGPALPALPAELALRLSLATKVNFVTDAPQEPLLALMRRPATQTYTAATARQDDAYNVISFSAAARGAPAADSNRSGSHVVIPFPGKPTFGAEPLGKFGIGPLAREYFGVPRRAGLTPPIDASLAVIASLARRHASDSSSEWSAQIFGLNPQDEARIEISGQNRDGQTHLLATLPPDAAGGFDTDAEVVNLIFRIVSNLDGRELGAAFLPMRSQPGRGGSERAADPGEIRDIIAYPPTFSITMENLEKPEGPFPQWQLPLIRWLRRDHATLVVHSDGGIKSVRLTLSARLHVRPAGILEVVVDGTSLKQLEFNDPQLWQTLSVDVPLAASINRIELRDKPLPPEYDWADYLLRYPDVKRHLEMTRQAPAQGAREHYDLSGKAEGRTMLVRERPAIPQDAYRFMFREIKLEATTP